MGSRLPAPNDWYSSQGGTPHLGRAFAMTSAKLGGLAQIPAFSAGGPSCN
jgi:hypothetical protein